MSAFRQRFIHIQTLEIGSDEKARMMHGIMTEGYNISMATLHLSPPTSPHSAQLDSDETAGPETPAPCLLLAQQREPYYLAAQDLQATYAPVSASSSHVVESSTGQGSGMPQLGCAHYKRNVKLQCSSCNHWHTCRFCHDKVENHMLNRRATKHMLCMLCKTPQPVGESCVKCGHLAAWYYCPTCKFWDNDNNKSIYHCNDCGICRIGQGLGKDFFHCKTCGVCMSISIADSHRCIERATDCDCPICEEYMFTSPEAVVFMRCGHSIHRKCYYDYMKTSYRCPICSKSVVNMETQFRNTDRAIESQPMPEHFRDTKALVYCNDCCAKSSVKYHWLGLKCSICDSYNTAQIKILSGTDANSESGYISQRSTGEDLESFSIQITQPSTLPRGRSSQILSHLPPTASSTSGRAARRPISSNSNTRTRYATAIMPPRSVRSSSPSLIIAGSQLHRPRSESLASSEIEDEELDFWGGESPRSRPMEDDHIYSSDEEESDDASDDVQAQLGGYGEDDDGDEEDDIVLIGHR
ncbi:MAG: hypothetical protein M1829_000586 [Trizodia sp. TS-e1964]|nr:MAG: hypothetical protein M1829_000586 [Trizodia sp. TS-e1964]